MNDPTAAAKAAGTHRLAEDLSVDRLGYGAMRITGEGIWGEPPDPDRAKDVVRRAVELGVTFIDTADSYGPDVSERLLGEALSPYPPDVVVATKAGLTRPGPGVWEPDGRPEHLKSACEGSLARLQVDAIDLYQFHRPDPEVPIEESFGALVELQEEGKVVHLGLSNVNVDQLDRCRAMAPVVSVQNRFNLTDRSSAEVLARCEADGIAFIPWYPLGGDDPDAEAVLDDVAAAHGATTHQVALAWLLAHSQVMVPIPGTGSVDHLEENIAAANLELTAGEVERLDQLT